MFLSIFRALCSTRHPPTNFPPPRVLRGLATLLHFTVGRTPSYLYVLFLAVQDVGQDGRFRQLQLRCRLPQPGARVYVQSRTVLCGKFRLGGDTVAQSQRSMGVMQYFARGLPEN